MSPGDLSKPRLCPDWAGPHFSLSLALFRGRRVCRDMWMKVAALTALSYQLLSNEAAGSTTGSALQLHAPEVSLKQPQEVCGVCCLCSASRVWGGLVVLQYRSITVSHRTFCGHPFSVQWLLHLSTVEQSSNPGSPCTEDPGLCVSVMLA